MRPDLRCYGVIHHQSFNSVHGSLRRLTGHRFAGDILDDQLNRYVTDAGFAFHYNIVLYIVLYPRFALLYCLIALRLHNFIERTGFHAAAKAHGRHHNPTHNSVALTDRP